MSKLNELLTISEQIADTITALNEEITNVEGFYRNKDAVSDLRKENEYLEKLIDEYRQELANLERANCKTQTYPVLNVPSNDLKVTQPLAVKKDSTGAEQASKKNQKKENKKQEKNEGTKKGSSEKNSNAVAETVPVHIGALDLKVGKIVHIKKHDDADTLYVEQIDIGKTHPITVISGLVQNVPIEEMRDRLVIVLCNLKPVKMRGITSEGMVMCACTPEKVEVLAPPVNSKPGDVVTVPGYPAPPDGPEPVLQPKKKIFETVAPELITDEECFATFRGVRWHVSGGFVKSATLAKVNIK